MSKEMEDMEKTWGPMNLDIDIKEEMEIVKESMKNKYDSDEESMVGEVSFSKDPNPPWWGASINPQTNYRHREGCGVGLGG